MPPPGPIPLASQHETARQILAVLGQPAAGVCLTGPAGSGKSTILASVLAQYEGGSGSLSVLPASASPAALAATMAGARHGSTARGWIVAVDDADQLRRDTLDVLEQLLTEPQTGLRMLFTGRATLLDRLKTTGRPALLDHLTAVGVPLLTVGEVAMLQERGSTAPGMVPLASELWEGEPPEPRRLSPLAVQGIAAAGALAAVTAVILLVLPGYIPQQSKFAAPARSRTVLEALAPPADVLPADVVPSALPGRPAVLGPSTRDFARSATVPGALVQSAEPAPVPSPAPLVMPTKPVREAGRLPSPAPELPVPPAEPTAPVSRPAPSVLPTNPVREASRARSPAPRASVPLAQFAALAPVPRPMPSIPPTDRPEPNTFRPDLRLATARGLVLLAEPGDTLKKLYRRVYRGQDSPSYEQLAAANPQPLHPGALVVFPAPLDGWRDR